MRKYLWNKWASVTREERFFTCVLFHDLRKDSEPFLRMISEQVGIPASVRVVDVGFEVCFFRDYNFKKGRRVESKSLAKQTFDLVLTLSNGDLCVIEAKAQQGFNTRQINSLLHAKMLIENEFKPTNVHLIAICSSRYSPRPSTLDGFAKMNWSEIADKYRQNKVVFERGDYIYGK